MLCFRLQGNIVFSREICLRRATGENPLITGFPQKNRKIDQKFPIFTTPSLKNHISRCTGPTSEKIYVLKVRILRVYARFCEVFLTPYMAVFKAPSPQVRLFSAEGRKIFHISRNIWNFLMKFCASDS